MSIRPLFLVFSLLLSPLGLAQGGRSAPNLTSIAQSRWTSAFAYAPPYSDSGFAEASGFRPFESDLAASSGGAVGSAYQESQVLPDAIVANGDTFSSGWVLNDSSGSSSGGSWVEVRFSVATKMSYRARGKLSAFGSPALGGTSASHLELRDGNGVPLLVREATGFEHLAIDERGLLAPGEYVLLVWAHSAGGGQLWFDTRASFDLAFEVQPVSRPPR